MQRSALVLGWLWVWAWFVLRWSVGVEGSGFGGVAIWLVDIEGV